jgi:hypothetical protein
VAAWSARLALIDMAWRVTSVGKSEAVSTDIANQLAALPANEQEIASQVSVLITGILKGCPGIAVEVIASGARTRDHSRRAMEIYAHEVNVRIEPVWGFVE